MVVAGPTASGKTESALLVAEILGGEIISADSMQIYRYMDIGTAKATQEEQGRVPHHLINIRNPGESFSVAEYQVLATEAIHDVQRRGKLAILCGGTGQYLCALMQGLIFSPAAVDPVLRQQLEREADEHGLESLWSQLLQSDPATAARLSPADRKRIIRALEVQHQTGEPMSLHNARSREAGPEFTYIGFCLTHDRPVLYQRIDQRVELMIERGLIDEVRYLLTLNLPAGSTCLQAIGYKELISSMQNGRTCDEAIATIQQASRRYAKRQLTWFRKMENMIWLENMTPTEAAGVMIDRILEGKT